MKKRTIIGLVATAIIIPTTVWAAGVFYKSGTVKRTLIDNNNYGTCMIQLNTAIGGGCSSNWVSLDCEGKYLTKGMGDRMLNVAMIAQTMKKRVSVKVDSGKKFGGYCVATRIDLLN